MRKRKPRKLRLKDFVIPADFPGKYIKQGEDGSFYAYVPLHTFLDLSKFKPRRMMVLTQGSRD